VIDVTPMQPASALRSEAPQAAQPPTGGSGAADEIVFVGAPSCDGSINMVAAFEGKADISQTTRNVR
jgi:hypothetical protein